MKRYNIHMHDYDLLFDTALEDVRQDRVRALFVHTNATAGARAVFDSWLEHRKDFSVLQAAAGRDVFEPYYPFLPWLRDKLGKWAPEELEKIFAEVGVYAFQRELLKNYLISGTARRFEELIPDEILYERERMLESIAKLFFHFFGEAPLIVVLENLQFVPASTFAFLRYLANCSLEKPFLVLASMVPDCLWEDEVLSEACQNLGDALGKRRILVDLPGTDETDVFPSRLPESVPEQVRMVVNCYHFLAYQDCRRLIDLCYPRWLDSRGGLKQDTEYRMYQILGDAANQLEQLDDAQIHYTSLLNLGQKNDDSRIMAEAYRKLGLIHLKKDDIERAEQLASRSIKLSKDVEDLRLHFYAYFLQFLIEDKGRKQSIDVWRESYHYLLQLASKLNLDNTISYLYTNPYGTYSSYDRDDEALHDLGIEIARRYDNQHRLAAAYQTKGLIYAVKGEYDRVITYYEQSREIKQRINNPLELAFVHNGLGFYHYLSGNYPRAFEYYVEALDYLKVQREFHEIAHTLFNISAAFFMGFEHGQSIALMEELFLLMRILHLPNLAYHSMFGLCALLALAYLKSGNSTKAYELLARIRVRNLKPYPKKNEEFFLFYLLRGLLAAREKQPARAKRCFRACRYFLKQTNDVITYMEPRFWYETFSACAALDLQEEAAAALVRGKESADNLGYRAFQELFRKLDKKRLKTGSETFFGEGFEKQLPDFTWIREAARMEMNVMKLHRKIQEVNFLNAVQSLSGKNYKSRTNYIKDVIHLLTKSFLIDRIYLHFYREEKWECFYKYPEESPDVADTLLAVLARDSHEKYFADTKQLCREAGCSQGLFSVLISLPIVREERIFAHLLCVNEGEEGRLSREDVQVLSITARQIGAALEKIEQQKKIIHQNKELEEYNQRLEQTVSTDILTGAHNRFSLHRRLREEETRFNRYRKQDEVHFSVIFLDLDNFKFYNDTFGHKLGDVLLAEFSGMLDSIIRHVDFLARYGGDEFVILLPETGLEGAKHTARRILDGVQAHNHFKDRIELFLGQSIEIPEGKRLSCSIGIAQHNNTVKDDIEKLLQMADKALYEAKKHGKNAFTVFGNEEAVPE